MATYDLIPTMTKYLDPQLAFALLEFIRARAIYKDTDVLEAQIKLLKATNMVEFTMELYNELHGANAAPKEMEERRVAVIQRVTELQENSQRMIAVIADQSMVQNLKADRNLNNAFLKESFGIGPEQVETLFDYAKCIYECGDYEAAGELLHQYCTYSVDPLKLLSAMWGKLASEILAFNYDAATETLTKLREAIDMHLFADALKQLQQRTWLLHWALFIFWNTPDGASQLLDLCLQDKFSVAMQVNSPHLIRYLVAAQLVCKAKTDERRDKWNNNNKAIKRILASEEYQYSDPVTDFHKAVYLDYDFNRAQEQLQKCQELIANDYFLAEVKDTFTEQARMAIFEVYCRIHQRINLDALAQQVGMTRGAAELWISQLIRTSRLDARIDSASGIIVMGTQSVDPLDAVMERTNNLSVRTFKVANAVMDAIQNQTKATPAT
eukprot:jgi/Ulvmu1/736/UM010_0109.1